MSAKHVNYYLFIIDKPYWDIVKSGNIIGSDSKKIYNKINENDKILIYVSGLSEIKALYEIVSKYKEETPLFPEKNLPFRFKLNLIELFEHKSEFRDLIHKLDFIENKEKWYTHLGGIQGVKPLSLRDFTAIIKTLK